MKGPAITSLEKAVAYFRGTHDDATHQCIQSLAATPNIWRLGSGIDQIRKLAKAQRAHEGQLVIRILWVFYGHSDSTDALAHSYAELAAFSKRIPPRDAAELCDEFRKYRNSTEIKIALNYVSDCQVALAQWILAWNRKVQKSWDVHEKKISKLH